MGPRHAHQFSILKEVYYLTLFSDKKVLSKYVCRITCYPAEGLMRADRFISMRQQFLRVAQALGIPIVLLALSSTALAQIEPALPGSIEYSLINSNQSWIEISDPITIGT